MRRLQWATTFSVVFLSLVAAGCSAPAFLTSKYDESVSYKTQTLATNDGALTLSYPEITSFQASSLNRAIQQWIGQTCPLPDTDSENSSLQPDSAQQCMKQMQAECRLIPSPVDRSGACAMHARVTVATNTRGILGLVLNGTVYNGSERGTGYRIYKNLSVDDGSTITLSDMVEDPQSDDLKALIKARLRENYQLAPTAPLTAAGFTQDDIPVTNNVLIQPQGLRFTYQNYEIAPYSLGQPTVFIAYDKLEPLMKKRLDFDSSNS